MQFRIFDHGWKMFHGKFLIFARNLESDVNLKILKTTFLFNMQIV